MKQLFIIALLTATTASAKDFVNDAEPAILEVHYTRIEVTDTTKRNYHFFKDPVMLRIGKNKSVFCGTKRLWQDSIMECDLATFWAMDQAKTVSGKRDDTQLACGHYWSYIYKNIPDGKVIERCYFDMNSWQYSEDWENPEWEIGDNTKTILGYECVVASANYRGRKWTAWFAPEIPIQEGPWKLCGLPGLILEAHDANNEYIFEYSSILKGFTVYKNNLTDKLMQIIEIYENNNTYSSYGLDINGRLYKADKNMRNSIDVKYKEIKNNQDILIKSITVFTPMLKTNKIFKLSINEYNNTFTLKADRIRHKYFILKRLNNLQIKLSHNGDFFIDNIFIEYSTIGE